MASLDVFSNKNALKLDWTNYRGGGIWEIEILGLKSYIPVIEDFGLGKTVIEPKTLGTTALAT